VGLVSAGFAAAVGSVESLDVAPAAETINNGGNPVNATRASGVVVVGHAFPSMHIYTLYSIVFQWLIMISLPTISVGL